jgi:oxalate decarboxylase/phosphoglucose isomerase-like protein (cupin superfamily)
MKFINFTKNKNERRLLYDWDINFSSKSIKLIFLKSGYIVGNHYHKNKDEIFILINGSINKLHLNKKIYSNVKSPTAWLVKRGVFHKYFCKEKATIVCLASETFNHDDDFN